MTLILTEEQELIRDTAATFVRDHCEIDELRALRDRPKGGGADEKRWRQMAELGWLAIPFPEEYGGVDLGYAELGIVLEELGSRLVVSPFLSTIVMGGSALLLAGSEEQKQRLIPGIVSGETLASVAYQESARHDPFRIGTTARRDGRDFVLSGKKVFVLNGQEADVLIVAARTDGETRDSNGITLFLVNREAEGLSLTPSLLIDSQAVAAVELQDVRLSPDAVLGRVDEGGAVLDQILDRAAIALSSEMLGGAQAAFDRTVQYLKDREQFDVKIGTFQALQHRAGFWFCELELSRSIVLEALRAIDAGHPDLSMTASICKARLSDTFMRSGEEGVQMFGGVGMTDEEDIGFFLKCARTRELLLGDAGFHRDRYAGLNGY